MGSLIVAGAQLQLFAQHGVRWIVCKDGAKHPRHGCNLRPLIPPKDGVYSSSKCLVALELVLTNRMWWKPVLGQALGGQAASAFCLSETSLHVKMSTLTTEW